MATNFKPTLEYGAAGNADASASLAASTARSFNVDVSDKWLGMLMIKNTPGGSVAATRGVRVDVYERYGTSPTDAATPSWSLSMPSLTASTAEHLPIKLWPGLWKITLTNLDATNAVTLEATLDTWTYVTG